MALLARPGEGLLPSSPGAESVGEYILGVAMAFSTTNACVEAVGTCHHLVSEAHKHMRLRIEIDGAD